MSQEIHDALEAGSTATVYDPAVQEIGDQIAGLGLQNSGQLLSYLKDTYDIEPPATGVVVKDKEVEKIEEKTNFDVVLVSAGDKKLNVVKAVRQITGLGLKESKDLVEAAPKVVKEFVPKAEAEKLKADIEKEGGKVELR